MSKSKRYFEQEEELLQEVIEQGIQFNDLDPEDEDEFHQPFEHYEDTYEEAKRIFIERNNKNKGEHLWKLNTHFHQHQAAQNY